MEGREIIRRSLTLSDHMSTPATDGSSALKLRQEEATPPPPPPPHPHPAVSSFSSRRSLTLGSAIASEKREAFAARGALGASSSRTLMDIIREEHPMGPAERESVTANNPAAEINWRSFKNRLQIRTDGAGDSAAAGLSTSPVIARSVSVQRNELPVPSPAAPAEEEEQPVRMSLMALLEQTDGRGEEEEGEEEEEEVEEEERGGGGGGGMHYACCVCMVRHKGAAFIPCGHTFCRLCSRELWVSRGNCPLCNGYILEILDIF